MGFLLGLFKETWNVLVWVVLGTLLIWASLGARVSRAQEPQPLDRDPAFLSRGLREAAMDGRSVDVERYLKLGADPEARSAYGKTALMLAALRGNGKVVRLLVESGANVDATDDHDNTALHYAAYNCNPSSVRELLSGRPNVNLRNHNRRTPLHNAAEQGCAPTVQMLIAAPGIDINAKDDWYKTPWDYAAYSSMDFKTAEFLTRAGGKMGGIGLAAPGAPSLGELQERRAEDATRQELRRLGKTPKPLRVKPVAPNLPAVLKQGEVIR